MLYPDYEYRHWMKTCEERLDPDRIAQDVATFKYKPKISIVTPVYNTPQKFLDAAVRSVQQQLYQNWELCICDDASTDGSVRQTLRQWEAQDSRIKVTYSPRNEHISAASNHALALATGEFVGLLDHDDEITPDALYQNVKLLQEHPDADMIYSDEDKLDRKGSRVQPLFKPDWSPEYMLETMYTIHFGVYRRNLLDEIGGFRRGFEGGQDHDLVLRISEQTDKIFHIPKILYHWRMAPGSGAGSCDAKPYGPIAAKKAIAEHLERRGIKAQVVDGPQPGRYRVIYEQPIAPGAPAVSIIVPNYNHARFLRQRLESILRQTFRDFELILIDDCSTDESREILSSYANNPRARLILNRHNSGSPFMQWNRGARLARGKYIWIAESDDYADTNFLQKMVAMLESDPAVVLAWCRSRGVSAECKLQGFADDYLTRIDPSRWRNDFCADGDDICREYFVRCNAIPNASAVIFRKSAYEQVGGADERLRLCGDWLLWAAMALMGKVSYTSQPLNFFRRHSSSVRSRTSKAYTDVAEYLRVSKWILERVSPPRHILDDLYSLHSHRWVPALLSTHVPLDVKRTTLHYVHQLDPHPVWHAFYPTSNTIRLKFLRHWRELTSHIRQLRAARG